MPIPVIDLFAGPGGLGEGFSAFSRNGEPIFKIKLSIEKDFHAHQTLELRAFFRAFPVGQAPDDYYEYLAGSVSRDQLFARHPEHAERARNEAWLAELGGRNTPNTTVDVHIEEALGNRVNWLLIGGPPCQAYSVVARARRREDPEFHKDEKHFLYREYLRILAVHQPPVFVMENVKGLLSSTVKQHRTFEHILADLMHPRGAAGSALNGSSRGDLSYHLMSLVKRPTDLFERVEPEDFVVCSEDYGIPQTRHRIIILGIRSDLARSPGVLTASPPPTVEDIIGDLPKLRSGLSREADSGEIWRDAVREMVGLPLANGEVTSELCTSLDRASNRVGAVLERGGRFMVASGVPRRHARWFTDSRLRGVCNHETRIHIREDLHRYFFAAVFARNTGRSPLLEDFPKVLLPEHKNVSSALKQRNFNDRFRVQIAGLPANTIVSHIAKDGHYYIHYDPSQCRSLTVRETARLQTFPDNYFFEGPRTEQYPQVGNAVPPLLARQIAEIVAELLT